MTNIVKTVILNFLPGICKYILFVLDILKTHFVEKLILKMKNKEKFKKVQKLYLILQEFLQKNEIIYNAWITLIKEKD